MENREDKERLKSILQDDDQIRKNNLSNNSTRSKQ